ncbi:efflux RND transporter periplasmic adaptor subunit [Burkholderia sp. Ac-20345]|uniref:efflux RND transporter periplasmic adaptor subunit n=1 Tax=Burkholderia sp. Ac-20345 TaxID=2703891 RepID=UPI00197BBEA2|nr:efflux RND transporter periplasmic adaptor subunit [Burkholderia sp. Ac-20345]MBN3777289.1 efflux RND transporter periplasmic adaptor subunit [Burkholderia sp. Ac-20345]
MSTEFDVRPPGTPRYLKPLAIAGAIAALAVAAAGLVARMHDAHAVAAWTVQQAIPTVATVAPQPAAADALVLPGRLDAYVDAPIYARVPGYLHAWYADIGAHVKAGQLLASIDTPDLDQQLQQARADLQSATANERLAAVTAARWAEMLAQDSVSQQEADEKRSDLDAKRAAVAASTANVRRLEALESFKRLTAPFDGIVTARKTDVGALIDAGSSNGAELFTVSDARRLRLYVHVPQDDSAAIRAGMRVALTVPERPGRTFDATLADSAQSIDPASGTLLAQFSIANPAGTLFPGEYAQVRIAMPDTAHALSIPASTLIFRHDGLQVAVLDGTGHARLRNVSIATDLGTRVEIASGLTAGDRVIDNPPDSLADGDPVRIAGTATTERAHG